MSRAETVGEGLQRCRKCGFVNAPGMKFCGNCGVELMAAVKSDHIQSLSVLQIVTSIYVLLTIAFSSLVQNITILLVGYSVVGVAGLYVGYVLLRGGRGRWMKVASAVITAMGMGFTGLAFLLGLSLAGLVSPSWVLFVACAILLWLGRKSS